MLTEGFDREGRNYTPLVPPDAEVDDAPIVAICLNDQWIPYVQGAIDVLRDPLSWVGDDDTVNTALRRADNLAALFTDPDCAAGDCQNVPFWQSDDGSDTGSDEPSDTWYNELSYFVIEAFLATMISPSAAITFVTTIRTLRLAYIRAGWGGFFEVLIDGDLWDTIDTYHAGTPLGETIIDTGDDDQHTITIQPTGDHNENATEHPVYGGYPVSIVRQNIRWVYPNISQQIRYNEGTDTFEQTPDGGATWLENPDIDPRTHNHFPPPDTSDPRCDAAARISAATSEAITSIIATLEGGAALGAMVNTLLTTFTPIPELVPLIPVFIGFLTVVAEAGALAMHDAFDAFDYDELTCKIYKQENAEGRLIQATFDQLLADIYASYTDLTETVLYQMYANYGFGVLNDAASTRSETGDCGACDNTFEYEEYFDDPLQWATIAGGVGWLYPIQPMSRPDVAGHQASPGVCYPTHGRLAYDTVGSERRAHVTIDFGRDVYITYLDLRFYNSGGAHPGGVSCYKDSGVLSYYQTSWSGGGVGCLGGYYSPNIWCRYIDAVIVCTTSYVTELSRVIVHGHY